VTSERALDVSAPAAPPRRNGELVFASPWESRIFGVTLALLDTGRFTWDEFRARLIAALARSPDGARYYDSWTVALEELLVVKGICTPTEIAAHERVLAARPPGHDHRDSVGH
jgi:nitrile hydratase accessory protein